MGVKPAISLGFRAHWPTTYTATYTGLPDASNAMDEDTLRPRMPAPLGGVESHAGMLKIPPDGQLLYKMITVDNLLRSIVGGYQPRPPGQQFLHHALLEVASFVAALLKHR